MAEEERIGQCKRRTLGESRERTVECAAEEGVRDPDSEGAGGGD